MDHPVRFRVNLEKKYRFSFLSYSNIYSRSGQNMREDAEKREERGEHLDWWVSHFNHLLYIFTKTKEFLILQKEKTS